MREIGNGGLQQKIIKSVKERGGKSYRLHGSYRKGIPDLVIAMPNFPLFLSEAKHLGKRSPKTKTFPVPLTYLQRDVAVSLYEVNRDSVIILVGVEIDRAIFLYAVPPTAMSFTAYETTHVRAANGGFPIRGLIEMYYADQKTKNVDQAASSL